VYALIYAQLAVASVKAAQLAFYGWRRWTPKLRLRRRDLKGFVGFGLYQMGERTIYYWSSNIDYVLIGRFLGPEQLGLYTIAYQLVVMPVSRLAPVLTRVAFPVFAKRQHDDAALRRGFESSSSSSRSRPGRSSSGWRRPRPSPSR
jgi:O-antigen/teichoic acid export membrane protein